MTKAFKLYLFENFNYQRIFYDLASMLNTKITVYHRVPFNFVIQGALDPPL